MATKWKTGENEGGMMEWDDMTDKQKVLGMVTDLVLTFLTYDRKEDEEFPRGKIENMISAGDITVDEITKVFHDALVRGATGVDIVA